MVAPVITASFSSGSLQSSRRRSSREVSSFVMVQYFLSRKDFKQKYFTSYRIARQVQLRKRNKTMKKHTKATNINKKDSKRKFL
jgi:hypothetical protein